METKNEFVMGQPKKLIEVAMPIKEISAESVRDKSIRQGHISTLHIWWARRPLPACRAVAFASLIPDPLDINCPKTFKEAVEILLGKESNIGDPYKPYDDIPYTAAFDRMEDNPRNRVLMFIGKFSDEYCANERIGKPTPTANMISNYSLIKSENKTNVTVLSIARKLIWVAHNSGNGYSARKLIEDYENHYQAVLDAETELYSTTDRHKQTEVILNKGKKLNRAIESYLSKMPKVFDPFAGGGAIPLEAARLGCKSYGNDLNPVAHVILKGSTEFPQKFGKPVVYSRDEFILLYGETKFNKISNEYKVIKNGEVIGIRIQNRLSFDVEHFGNSLLVQTEKVIGKYYPADKNGNKPVAYYWAKVGTCMNPSCRAEVPLLKQFYISKRRSANENQWIHFKPIIENGEINFEILAGKYDEEGWNNRGNLRCPVCGNLTDVKEIKRQCKEGILYDRLICVIEENKDGKVFRIPSEEELAVIKTIPLQEIPNESIQKNSAGGDTLSWGITKWGEMYSNRQLLVMHSLINEKKNLLENFRHFEKDYSIAISTYLAFLIDRIAMRNTRHNTWHLQQDTIEKVFGRQAISMVFDYPEMNPFSKFTSSAYSQLEQIINYIDEESKFFNASICENASSGDKNQFSHKDLDVVVTDPPYYDAIAYADLSDFFYIWLKRGLAGEFPMNFTTPQTPKSEECTALKHHHDNSIEKAKEHFENKLTQIFEAIEYQTKDIVSIMFAHQSTEAWTTLCNSILRARMNITGSWAIETENTGGLKQDKAFLASSVTVSCVPLKRIGVGEYKEIKKDIEIKVNEEVRYLYRLGLRGADLLTACFGQAVEIFGQYEKVEKADGREVTVAELLEMSKESAFNALLKGFDGDEFTKFYIGWLQLFGFTESDFDDAAKFARVGLTINVSDLFVHNLFIKKGSKQELAGYKERLELNHRIGEGSHSFIIDFVHKAMALYEGANRYALLAYIAKVAASPDNSFWRVITSLCEILPQGSNDYKQASGLLLNKDSLIRESKNLQQSTGAQGQLF